jgi:hypothetical protein
MSAKDDEIGEIRDEVEAYKKQLAGERRPGDHYPLR